MYKINSIENALTRYRAGDALLWLLFLVLFAPTIQWFLKSFSYSANRLSHGTFAVILGILIYKIWKYRTRQKELPERTAAAQTGGTRLPLAGFIFSVSAYLVVEYVLHINMFSAVFFGSALYCLLGFYLPEQTWKKGLIPTILLIQTLPFGNYLDTYLGFPLRIFSAGMVEQVLGAMNIPSVSQETIIIIENSASQVDLSCSGLKGIWSGLIFFFAVTWLERKPVTLGWTIRLALFLFTLTAFNTLRILILVIVDTVIRAPEAAARIHVPLGIIGFIFSCVFAWLMLRQGGGKTGSPVLIRPRPIPGSLVLILAAFLLTGIFLHQRPEPLPFTTAGVRLDLPAQFQAKEIPLTPMESSLLTKEQGDAAFKFKFTWEKKLTGTLLVAVNRNWRSHHDPQVCLTSGGLKIERSATMLINNTFPVKALDFRDQKLSAVYWFQSPSFITEDFSARVWAQLTKKEEHWALVSILFDRPIQGETNTNIKKLYHQLRREVHTMQTNNIRKSCRFIPAGKRNQFLMNNQGETNYANI
ncbi:MAG: exosortase O [bacterium]|nr:exosortase O [bacterium]